MSSPLPNNLALQSDIVAGGHVAGHDVNVYNYGSSQETIAYLQDLYKKLEDEAKSDPQVCELISELADYNRRIDGDVLGLEEKLSRGKHELFIDFALRKKETYSKLLALHQFSISAQKIHVHLLAMVETRFMAYVYIKICNGESVEEIQRTLHQHVVSPIIAELGVNALGLTEAHILGMVYLLTGNCHLKWEK